MITTGSAYFGLPVSCRMCVGAGELPLPPVLRPKLRMTLSRTDPCATSFAGERVQDFLGLSEPTHAFTPFLAFQKSPILAFLIVYNLTPAMCADQFEAVDIVIVCGALEKLNNQAEACVGEAAATRVKESRLARQQRCGPALASGRKSDRGPVAIQSRASVLWLGRLPPSSSNYPISPSPST
jgi:hypothetical protein